MHISYFKRFAGLPDDGGEVVAFDFKSGARVTIGSCFTGDILAAGWLGVVLCAHYIIVFWGDDCLT